MLTLPQYSLQQQNILQKYSVCRLCLCMGDLLDIFSKKTKPEFQLKDVIEELIQCEVEREEGFPWLICLTCRAKLTEFRLFKRRCMECKQAFDIRFGVYKPLITATIKQDFPVNERSQVNLESHASQMPGNCEEAKGCRSWMVASGNLYFKESVADMTEGDSGGVKTDRDPINSPTISSIIKVSREVDVGALGCVEAEPYVGEAVVTECIGIDEVSDEVQHPQVKLEQIEVESDRTEDSSPLCRIVGVDCLTVEQYEAGDLRAKESQEVDLSCVKTEPLVEMEGESNVNLVGDNGYVDLGTEAVPSEAQALQVVKQEPMNWCEVEEPFQSCSLAKEKKAKSSCIAANCPNVTWTPRANYVSLPRDPNQARDWLARAGRLDLLQLHPSELFGRYQLCTDHFDASVFTSLPERLLAHGAVPTIFSHNMVIEPVNPSGSTYSNNEAMPVAQSTTSVPAQPNVNGPAVKPRVKPPRKQSFSLTRHSRIEFSASYSCNSEEESIKHTNGKIERRKRCFVPLCPNKYVDNHEKIFISVPKDQRRKKWLKAANAMDMKFGLSLYCCEDHFEMEEDFYNYNQLRYVGVRYLKPKPDIVPRYFDCQVDRQKAHRPKPRESSLRVQRKKIIYELLNGGSKEAQPSPSPSPPVQIKTEDDKGVAGSNVSSESPSSPLPIKKEKEKEEPTASELIDISAENSCSSSSGNSSTPSHHSLPPALQDEEKNGPPSVDAVNSDSQSESSSEVKKSVKAPRKQTFNLRSHTELDWNE